MKKVVIIGLLFICSALVAQSNADSLSSNTLKFKPALETDVFDAYLNVLAIVDDTVNARNYLITKFFKDQKPQVDGFKNLIVENRVFVFTKVNVDKKEYYFFYEPAPRLVPLHVIFVRKSVSILSVINTLVQKKLL